MRSIFGVRKFVCAFLKVHLSEGRGAAVLFRHRLLHIRCVVVSHPVGQAAHFSRLHVVVEVKLHQVGFRHRIHGHVIGGRALSDRSTRWTVEIASCVPTPWNVMQRLPGDGLQFIAVDR